VLDLDVQRRGSPLGLDGERRRAISSGSDQAAPANLGDSGVGQVIARRCGRVPDRPIRTLDRDGDLLAGSGSDQADRTGVNPKDRGPNPGVGQGRSR
jgi:hypothetical protein